MIEKLVLFLTSTGLCEFNEAGGLPEGTTIIDQIHSGTVISRSDSVKDAPMCPPAHPTHIYDRNRNQNRDRNGDRFRDRF